MFKGNSFKKNFAKKARKKERVYSKREEDCKTQKERISEI